MKETEVHGELILMWCLGAVSIITFTSFVYALSLLVDNPTEFGKVLGVVLAIMLVPVAVGYIVNRFVEVNP